MKTLHQEIYGCSTESEPVRQAALNVVAPVNGYAVLLSVAAVPASFIGYRHISPQFLYPLTSSDT